MSKEKSSIQRKFSLENENLKIFNEKLKNEVALLELQLKETERKLKENVRYFLITIFTFKNVAFFPAGTPRRSLHH